MMNLETGRLVQQLEKNIPNLPEGSRGFATSLVENAQRWGPSETQLFWIKKLANQQPAKMEVAEVKLDKIQKLFQKAGEKLKYPKVILATHAGEPVQFKIAGPNSKYRGQIVITDGGPFGRNVWYGNIDQNGTWRKTNRVHEYVVELVEAFANDPVAVVAQYGRTVGNCSFCSKALDDERSLKVGYGPVCARNYGMPWGNNK